MSPVDAITFTLLRSEEARSDWEWLDHLPVGGGRGLPVMFFDGMRQVTEYGMRQELLEQGSAGGVIVDDQVRDIPSLCSSVLQIQPSGDAALLDFRRGATTTRVATPLGFDLPTTLGFVDDLKPSH